MAHVWKFAWWEFGFSDSWNALGTTILDLWDLFGEMDYFWNLGFSFLKMCSTHGTLLSELFEEVPHGRNQFM